MALNGQWCVAGGESRAPIEVRPGVRSRRTLGRVEADFEQPVSKLWPDSLWGKPVFRSYSGRLPSLGCTPRYVQPKGDNTPVKPLVNHWVSYRLDSAERTPE